MSLSSESHSPDSGDSFLQSFRDIDQWEDFTTPQAVQGPDCDRYLTFISFEHPLYLPLSCFSTRRVVEVTARVCFHFLFA